MVSYLVYLSRCQSRVHKDRPRIHTGQCQKDRDKGTAILADNHDAIARSNTQAFEPTARIRHCRG
jgi:hypothetical protein